MIFRCLFRLPFGSLFGCFLGSQIDQKEPPETTSKSASKTVPKKVPKVVPKMSSKEPKLVKNDVLDQPLVDKCSQMAVIALPVSILEPFCEHSGAIFLMISEYLLGASLAQSLSPTSRPERSQRTQSQRSPSGRGSCMTPLLFFLLCSC